MFDHQEIEKLVPIIFSNFKGEASAIRFWRLGSFNHAVKPSYLKKSPISLRTYSQT